MGWKKAVGIPVVFLVVLAGAVFIFISTYDYANLKPVLEEQVAVATGRTLTIAGPVRLRLGLTPSLVVDDVGFENAAWGSRPELVSLKKLQVKVALLPLLSRNIVVREFILIEPDILLETDKQGQGNWVFSARKKETAPDKKGGAGPGIRLENVRIKNGRVTYLDGRTGKTYTLLLDDMTIAPAPQDRLALDLNGSYNRNAFSVNGTVAGLDALLARAEPWPLDLTVTAAGSTIKAAGTMALAEKGLELDLAVSLDSPSLGRLAGLAGIKGIPDVGPVALSAGLGGNPAGSLAITGLEVRLGESDLKGSASVALGGPRPRLTADLTSNRLDLRPLQPAEEKAEVAATEKEKKVFPDTPLKLAGLKAADLTAIVKIGRLVLRRAMVDDLSVRIILKDGRLKLDPMTAKIAGGSMTGRLALREQGNKAVLAAAFKIEKLDLDRLLKEIGAREMVAGKLDIEADLAGSGGSVAALMASLDGRTRLVMGKGRINNKQLGRIGVDLAGSLTRMINPLAEKSDYTEANCFVSGFAVKNGLARSTALLLDTPRMSVIGDGRINLKTEGLSLALKPLPKKGVAGFNLNLAELARSFKLGGTLARPALVIDPGQTALAIGKAAGGIALFGPVGIAAVLAGKDETDENPCLTALAKVEKGAAAKPGDRDKGAIKNSGAPLDGDAGEIGGTLEKLFGR
ncbi:MAG: AsmA family protein [Desulfobacterales bacterium]|nr:AsmA family protein [Desulfobacterales bacterium]